MDGGAFSQSTYDVAVTCAGKVGCNAGVLAQDVPEDAQRFAGQLLA